MFERKRCADRGGLVQSSLLLCAQNLGHGEECRYCRTHWEDQGFNTADRREECLTLFLMQFGSLWNCSAKRARKLVWEPKLRLLSNDLTASRTVCVGKAQIAATLKAALQGKWWSSGGKKEAPEGRSAVQMMKSRKSWKSGTVVAVTEL